MSDPTDDGGPAFPEAIKVNGMTLLDWFAGRALVGLLAAEHQGGDDSVPYGECDSDRDGGAYEGDRYGWFTLRECAYSIAAAMVAEKRRLEGKE